MALQSTIPCRHCGTSGWPSARACAGCGAERRQGMISLERVVAALLGIAVSAFLADAKAPSLFLCGAAGALIILLLSAKLSHHELRLVRVRDRR